MIEFVASGRVFDLVVAILALEALALLAFALRGGSAERAKDLAGFVVAGLGLAVAARAALAGGPWPAVAGGLTVAFVAHVYDLRRRWLARR